MACFSPLKAWRNPDDPGGRLLFSPHTIGGSIEHADRTCLKIPCGQCIGCRLEYSRSWAVRCCHESSLHIFNFLLLLHMILPIFLLMVLLILNIFKSL